MTTTELGWLYFRTHPDDPLAVLRMGDASGAVERWDPGARGWTAVPGEGLARAIERGGLDYLRITPDEAHHLTAGPGGDAASSAAGTSPS